MVIPLLTSASGSRLLVPRVLFAHTKLCPASKKPGQCSNPVSAAGGATAGGGQTYRKPDFKRALTSAKVRLGFLPDNWFTFFYNKTGVTGPYILMFNLTNYCVSKEIYVLEHEYYLGLSALIMILYVTKTFGKDIGASLDKEVDAVIEDVEKGRKSEIAHYEDYIKMTKKAQFCAEGQKLLMDAKKENVAMQLEAVYRERAMLVYHLVRGRMNYHIKRHEVDMRIQQKWMIGWILQNVRKSITPEFEQQALDSAIKDLAAAAGRAT